MPTRHAAILRELAATRARHRRDVVAAVAGVVFVFTGAVFLLGFTPRILAPLLLLSLASAASLGLALKGRAVAGFWLLAAVLTATLVDAHAFLRVTELAPAYTPLLVALGATILPRRQIGALFVCLLVAVVGMRAAHPVDALWVATTLDSITLLVATSTIVAVDRLRVQRDARHLKDALVELRDATDRAEQSASAARAASDAKSDFLARASHELRTPINAILGYAELIGEEGTAPDAEQDIDSIVASARNLLHLVDDLLDLSRVEAGRIELHPERVRLTELVAPTVRAAEPLARRNGNVLTVEVSDAETELDVGRVRQVLANLLSNAARFTEGGRIRLAVHATDETVELEVTDTGIGIRPERLPLLFQPFVQAERDTSYRYGGTGLGLAITDRFVRAMGGRVDVQSTVGAGSRFRVTLPRWLGAPSAGPPAITTSGSAASH
ncbi:MAG: HAMP domain-containing sensor histidine kinase [Myxococcota bacterium]